MLDLNYEPIPASERLPIPEYIELMDNGRIDGRGLIFEGNSTYYRLQDINGSDPLQLAASQQYLEEIPPPLAWELYAVEVVAVTGDIPVDAEKIGEAEGVNIFRLDDPRPFALPVYNVLTVENDEQAYGFFDADWFDPRGYIIIEGDAPTVTQSEERGSAELMSVEPEEIVVSVNVPQDAMLSLALMDYPGWTAQLDGGEVDIYRAYGGLSAVYVPAGQHTLTLTFESRFLPIAAGVSAVSWLLVIGCLIFVPPRQHVPADDEKLVEVHL
jgi:hypothetical protein